VFSSAWDRPAGYHHADIEWYVMYGALKLGERLLGKGGYFRAPAGLRVPEISVQAGSEILIFREYGAWGFSVSAKDRSDFIPRGGNTASQEPGELTVVDSSRMEWMPNIYEGDTQRFLKLKPLFIDPSPEGDNNKGFVSMLAWAPPGWSDNRMVHPPVLEESYSLDGQLVYNFGTLDAGTYFFRPAKVKHGHFVAGEERRERQRPRPAFASNVRHAASLDYRSGRQGCGQDWRATVPGFYSRLPQHQGPL
jgi:hypothetical protein